MSIFVPKNAVVTGSAQGLGKAIAVRLAADGCNVVLNDLPVNQSLLDEVVADIESRGGKTTSLAGDASESSTVQALIDRCVASYGSLDIMVCNAGVCVVKPALEMEEKEVERLFHINYISVWNGYRLGAKQMIRQGGGGRIIGAASQAAKRGALLMAAYSSTKFAIRGLTQAVAQEWGQHGITVNAYAPGTCWTPAVEKLGEVLGTSFQSEASNPREMFSKSTALGRIGEGEDIAGLVSFLASKDSAFITGQTILADGGMVFD